VDERARYFRRLKRLRGAARRWSVLGGGLTAAAAVLTPYNGIGPGDAGWAAAAGSAAVLAVWRWKDHRELAATPPPPPTLPEGKLSAALERFPAGRTVLREVRRQRHRYALRGSAVADTWDRLDRASQAMAGLAGRLTGAGETALLEGATAERWLRDLGQRVASVERAVPLAQGAQREALIESHAGLAEQFGEGVTAYEELVAAAASFVAEDGHPVVESRHPAYFGLVDAADRLRGFAEGLAELRTTEIRTPDLLRTGDLQAGELRTGDLHTSDLRADDLRTDVLRDAEPRTEELRDDDLRTEELREDDLRTTEIRATPRSRPAATN
jgi:hypothetical protein